MSKQLAIRVSEWRKDDLEGVAVTEVPIPETKAGEALVRLTLRPVNPVDLEILHGGLAAMMQLPAVPGSEGALKRIQLVSAGKEALEALHLPWVQSPALAGVW